jgi:4a-hydroxytetrahydrobiopterin dehydratase
MATVLTAAQVQGREGLADWRVVAGRLHATFRTGTLARGIELVRRIGEIADELDHHPDLDVRYFRVHVRSVTHDAGGLTERDVRLARRVSAVAAELALPAEPQRTEQVELAVGATDPAAARPFWQALLGYRTRTAPGTDPAAASDLVDPAAGSDLVDPAGRGPAVHLRPGEPAGSVCVEVHVPHDAVADRLRAALDAGGRVVSDAHAPAWWVLADPDGTEVHLRTWQEPSTT